MTINPNNPEGYESAVRLEGRDALVTANAGSGKTYLLVERYFYLLSRGIHPRSVAAFTFTEKAARQLKEKILLTLPRHPDFSALPKATLREWRDQIHQASIGTIHQFCLRVLQESTHEGRPFKGKIIDEATQIKLRESALNQILREGFEGECVEIETLLPVYGMPGLRDVLRGFVVKQEFFIEGETVPADLPELEEKEKALMTAFLALAEKVKAQMDLAKQDHHWLSFNDLEILALEQIRRPSAALQKFLSPLTHLLVDEFQDTSPVQIALLDALRSFKTKKKQEFYLFAVGDPKQSIYRFRNVDRRLVEKTETSILKNGGRSFVLSKNYRSLPALVDFANHFSTAAFPQGSPSEGIRPSAGGKEIHIVPIETAEKDADRSERQTAEARWVATKLSAFHRQGRPWETMAVLFRASASALPLVDQLKALSIPFTLHGGRALFDRQEILDLKNLLFFLADPRENLHLIGVLRSPLFLISDAALYFLMAQIPKGESLFQFLSQHSEISLPPILGKILPDETAKIRWAADLLRNWVRQAPLLSPHVLLRNLVHQLDLRRLYGEIGGDWEAPLAIEQFLTWMEQLESEMDRPDLPSVVSLLKQLAKTPSIKPPLGDLVEGDGCVHLLTIHSAKGLQFPTVFLLDLGRGKPSFNESVQYQGGQWALKIPNPEGEPEETARFKAMKEVQVLEDAEENKRLLYVALTRAQDELWIPLHASSRNKNNLESLLKEHIPGEIFQNHLYETVTADLDSHLTPSIPTPPSAFSIPTMKQNLQAPLPRLTVSQLEAFHQCALKYYFSYHRGFSDEEWTDPNHPSQTLMGTLLHSGLHRSRKFPEESPAQIVQFLLQTQPLWNRELLVADLVSYLENFLSSPAYAKIRRAQEDHSELPFILQLNNGYVRGQLDRLVQYDGQWHLIDFKFSKNPLNDERVRKDYGFQLKTYALAAKRFLQGITPLIEVHLLGTGRALSIPFHEQELTDHQKELEDIIGRFQSIRLEQIRIHEFCYACPFNRKVPICPVPKGEVWKSP